MHRSCITHSTELDTAIEPYWDMSHRMCWIMLPSASWGLFHLIILSGWIPKGSTVSCPTTVNATQALKPLCIITIGAGGCCLSVNKLQSAGRMPSPGVNTWTLCCERMLQSIIITAVWCRYIVSCCLWTSHLDPGSGVKIDCYHSNICTGGCKCPEMQNYRRRSLFSLKNKFPSMSDVLFTMCSFTRIFLWKCIENKVQFEWALTARVWMSLHCPVTQASGELPTENTANLLTHKTL